jgi:hypothetical protein
VTAMPAPALTEDARPGSRNGYREVTVKTTAGPVALPPSPSLKTSPRLSEPLPSLTREAGPRPPVHTGIGACR